jgi:CheY-like chemotaxis protein
MEPEALADPKTKRFLIVDDDVSVLTLLEIMVHRDGFQIETAESGDGALRLIEKGPDAIVLDLILPGSTDGFGILKMLAEKGGKAPPIIVVSGHAGSKELEAVEKDPLVVALIRKPISQDKLLETLHKALKTRRPPPPGPYVKKK